MAQNRIKDFRIIRLRHLSDVAGIDYAKIRNNIVGDYGSLTDTERTRLFNAMQTEVEKACLALGFSYDGRPMAQQIPEPKRKRTPKRKRS